MLEKEVFCLQWITLKIAESAVKQLTHIWTIFVQYTVLSLSNTMCTYSVLVLREKCHCCCGTYPVIKVNVEVLFWDMKLLSSSS